MEKEKPTYYAIIPANVRYDKRLSASEKLLYAEITVLTNKTGECWASNQYFAELYDVTNVAVSGWIANLKECGYIESRMEYKEGSKQILGRYIKIVLEGIKEKFNTPIKEKFKDNNTSINTTSIKVVAPPTTLKEVREKAAKINEAKNFDLEKALEKWETRSGTFLDHLASYIRQKNLQPDSLAKLENIKNRFIRTAKKLEAYSADEVLKTMKWLNKKSEHEKNIKGELNSYSWTLETVLKELTK
jgi:hypothetical protein